MSKPATIETALSMLAHGFDSRDCPESEVNPDHLGPLVHLDADRYEGMRQSHRQKQCRKCGFLAIWEMRK